jgi:hypothetical protein
MRPWHFEHRVRSDLRQRRWLRLHASLIGALTLAVAWATSHWLLLASVERLSLRYGLSFAVAYMALITLLYLWARWLLSRREAELEVPQGDGASGFSGGPNARSDPSPFEPGGGGDFGGGGASGHFDGAADALGEGAAKGAGEPAGATAEVLGAADEAAVVLIPLAVVLALAASLGALLGFAVFGLFGVEVLLGVAVEIAFASLGGALAFKAQREGWLAAALRRTAGPAFVMLVAVVGLGAALDHWLPQARSLPHAIQLLRD